jgi:hypothetical protein
MKKEFEKKCITEKILEETNEIGAFAEKKYLKRLDNFQKVDFKDGVFEGAKWMQERMYSEEDMISFAHFYFREEFNSTMQNSNKSTDEILQEWFEQFKKTK